MANATYLSALQARQRLLPDKPYLPCSGQADNWQTLEGLRIHETNEVFAPTALGWAGLLAITLFFATVFFKLRLSQPTAAIAVALILSALSFLFLHLCLKSIRIKRALFAGW